MAFLLALALFAAAFIGVAIVSEKLTPLVGIGGLLALMVLVSLL